MATAKAKKRSAKRTAKRKPATSPKKARRAPAKARATAATTKRATSPRAEKAAAPTPRRAPRVRTQPESLRLRRLTASLTVNDLARSLRFYRDGLGFVIADRWEEEGELVGYMLRAGSCEIGIGRDDWAKGRDRAKGAGIRIWCETAQDVDVFAERLKAHGYALSEEPSDHSWGVRAFSVDDPDGFHLSIFRRIGD